MQRRHAKRMISLMLLIVFIAIFIIGQSAKSTYAETATSSNIEIPVEVDWKGSYKVPVTVNLEADGEIKQTITVTYDTDWKSKFINVPKYNSVGTEINYTITYEAADYGVKYKYSLSGNATNGFVIKIVALRDIYVGKVWNVMPNIVIPGHPDPACPPTMGGMETTSLDPGNPEPACPHTMTGMIATNLDSVIPATAPESLPEVPVAQVREATITEEVIEEDNPNFDALISAPKEVSSVPIPDAITVHLLADGVVVGTMQLTKDDNWEGRFVDYPRYDENDGHEIKYTTKEDPLAGYETSYFNGNIILNRSLIDVSVEKKWIGNSQSKAELTLHRACDYMKFDHTLNKHVRVKLDEEVATVELNAANNWKHTFSSLYEFYTPKGEDGVKYKYYVTEKSIPGYDTQITGNQDSGFVVTNKEINPKTPAPKNPQQPKTPNTGDGSNFNIYALLLLSTSALIPVMIYRRKKI